MTAPRYWVLQHEEGCLPFLRQMPDNSFDSLITDPPAAIGFMSKPWDSDRGGRAAWIAWLGEILTECLRVLKPGAHALVWALPRTAHWTATAVEDAGFEIRDRTHDIAAADGALQAFLDILEEHQREHLQRIIEGQASPVLYHLFLSGAVKGANGQRQVDMRVCELPGNHCDKNLHGKDPHICPESEEGLPFASVRTGLKPTLEHWILARKPMVGPLADNLLAWGTGGLRTEDCVIPAPGEVIEQHGKSRQAAKGHGVLGQWGGMAKGQGGPRKGRWPRHANLVHAPGCRLEGRDDKGVEQWVCAIGCPVRLLDDQVGVLKSGKGNVKRRSGADHEGNTGAALGAESRPAGTPMVAYGDKGGASRHFNRFNWELHYVPKASRAEKEAGLEDLEAFQPDTTRQAESLGANNPRNRGGRGRKNHHATVKPIGLMRHYVRLLTPPRGKVLDPFGGSGSTGIGAILEGCDVVLIEKEPKYAAIARARLEHWSKESEHGEEEGREGQPGEEAKGESHRGAAADVEVAPGGLG